jgi:hypothetical protein
MSWDLAFHEMARPGRVCRFASFSMRRSNKSCAVMRLLPVRENCGSIDDGSFERPTRNSIALAEVAIANARASRNELRTQRKYSIGEPSGRERVRDYRLTTVKAVGYRRRGRNVLEGSRDGAVPGKRSRV